MELQTLSNTELMNRFSKLVQTERKITHLVLECISEIDIRKIYLERAHPSLFDYLVKAFGYSPSAVVRRIESARLLREVPEIASKIEEGSLNLSQLSQVQQAIRMTQKQDSRKVPIDEKRKLLKKIENTTQNQTELILAKELNLPVVREEKERIHQNESVTLTITFSKEQIALLEKASDLMSHALPNHKWADVITALAQKEIQRRTEIKRPTEVKKPNKAAKPNTERKLNLVHDHKNIVIKAMAPIARKAIKPNLRKTIFATDKCCQFKDPLTNKICGSRRFLEIDHIQPIWAGGDNSAENLRILCSQHNKFKYAKESGLHPLRV